MIGETEKYGETGKCGETEKCGEAARQHGKGRERAKRTSKCSSQHPRKGGLQNMQPPHVPQVVPECPKVSLRFGRCSTGEAVGELRRPAWLQKRGAVARSNSSGFRPVRLPRLCPPPPPLPHPPSATPSPPPPTSLQNTRCAKVTPCHAPLSAQNFLGHATTASQFHTNPPPHHHHPPSPNTSSNRLWFWLFWFGLGRGKTKDVGCQLASSLFSTACAGLPVRNTPDLALFCVLVYITSVKCWKTSQLFPD
jgi:hypothetical protein